MPVNSLTVGLIFRTQIVTKVAPNIHTVLKELSAENKQNPSAIILIRTKAIQIKSICFLKWLFNTFVSYSLYCIFSIFEGEFHRTHTWREMSWDTGSPSSKYMVYATACVDMFKYIFSRKNETYAIFW